MSAYKTEWTDHHGHERTAYGSCFRVLRILGDCGGAHVTVFDTQSIASGASKAASEPTPAAAEPAKVDESEQQESEETTRQPPDGGKRQQPLSDAELGQVYGPVLNKQSAPTSPPITKEDSPPTKSGPTTTPSADSSPGSIFGIMENLLERMNRAEKHLGLLDLLGKNLHERVNRLWTLYASTTQAPAAPGLEEDKTT